MGIRLTNTLTTQLQGTRLHPDPQAVHGDHLGRDRGVVLIRQLAERGLLVHVDRVDI